MDIPVDIWKKEGERRKTDFIWGCFDMAIMFYY